MSTRMDILRLAAWGFVALAMTACAGQPAIDARMKPMIGASESELVVNMGRAPDASLRPEPGVRILQWRHETSFAVPNALLFYQYSGNAVQPIAHSATGMVSEVCVAEWTLTHGIATSYRLQGASCAGAP